MERTGKYLTFFVVEEFGVAVLKVREIMGLQQITELSGRPRWMKGILNLRGKVVSVVDLRRKFDFPEQEPTQQTCIIVVQIGIGYDLIGLIVDAVSEVINLFEDDVLLVSTSEPQGVVGITKTKPSTGRARRVVMLLDLEKVFTPEDIAALTFMNAKNTV